MENSNQNQSGVFSLADNSLLQKRSVMGSIPIPSSIFYNSDIFSQNKLNLLFALQKKSPFLGRQVADLGNERLGSIKVYRLLYCLPILSFL